MMRVTGGAACKSPYKLWASSGSLRVAACQTWPGSGPVQALKAMFIGGVICSLYAVSPGTQYGRKINLRYSNDAYY